MKGKGGFISTVQTRAKEMYKIGWVQGMEGGEHLLNNDFEQFFFVLVMKTIPNWNKNNSVNASFIRTVISCLLSGWPIQIQRHVHIKLLSLSITSISLFPVILLTLHLHVETLRFFWISASRWTEAKQWQW